MRRNVMELRRFFERYDGCGIMRFETVIWRNE